MSTGSGQGTPITAATPELGLYCTLAELKHRLTQAASYTAATLAFVSATKKITDSAKGLARFKTGKRIQVSGSDSNDGYYNIATGAVAAEIVTTEALADESAGAEITITDVTDPTDDNALAAIIAAVSRSIDQQCDRFFYMTSSETRYYSTEWPDWLLTDDIVSITTLKTDDSGARAYGTTWATTDYDLEPSNAALTNAPYTDIRLAPNGSYRFPSYRKSVQIVGVFGWPAVPDPIREACILQSMRLWKRKDAVFGVIGSAEMGQMLVVPKLDPDVKLLLQPFKRLV